MSSISKLLFQLFLTQKVRKESRTKNGQFKNDSRLESKLPSMAPLLQKKIWIKEPTSEWKYHKRVLYHVEKCPIAPNVNVLPRGRPLLLASLDQLIQKFLFALRSRSGLVTSVTVVSVAKALIARNPHFMLDHIDLDSSSWAKSLFRRMDFKKRMKITSKIEIPDRSKKEA